MIDLIAGNRTSGVVGHLIEGFRSRNALQLIGGQERHLSGSELPELGPAHLLNMSSHRLLLRRPLGLGADDDRQQRASLKHLGSKRCRPARTDSTRGRLTQQTLEQRSENRWL